VIFPADSQHTSIACHLQGFRLVFVAGLKLHDSLPNNATGHSSVFSNLSLNCLPQVQTLHMVVSDHSTDLVALSCGHISVLQVDHSSVMDPKCLNCWLVKSDSTASNVL